ncbi:Transcription initiation factor IIA gamma subunit [Pyrenophora seminiperda CCB06]|uniref:Transcription initiation factor IIA gamma subunit n=1 Tax=Pyrenophora seminiperda CCB06 TaxID=1302712 RepID=A0A3M7M339_9PLEO|nr:Transcription initiation factor IIA gamma subunit [Pyrenophora seminiperda CCB06]
MPRQLPWANKGGRSRTQVKSAPARQAEKPHIASTIEDDFFDGTVLASSRGKERATESDDDLPCLPAELSTPQTKARTKDAFASRNRRYESSSPPPVDCFEQPSVEGMHKGVSKFDLRDDEWMMVEDEFLETAKLFTRHLHMAEYEKLKKTIEEKKKQTEIARPVVAEAKLSATTFMEKKAKIQQQKQKQAIQDVFASQNDEDVEVEVQTAAPKGMSAGKATSSLPLSRNPPTSGLKEPPKSYEAQDSDSEDLDAQLSLTRPASKPTTTPAPTRTQTSSTSLEHTPASPNSTKANAPKPTFAKPTQPHPAKRSRSRISGATPFDMLDDWVPKKTHSSTNSSVEVSAKPAVACRTSISNTTSPSFGRSADASVDTRVTNNEYDANMSKETMSRIAKRKAERKKGDKEKAQKDTKLDDIPTFLF